MTLVFAYHHGVFFCGQDGGGENLSDHHRDAFRMIMHPAQLQIVTLPVPGNLQGSVVGFRVEWLPSPLPVPSITVPSDSVLWIGEMESAGAEPIALAKLYQQILGDKKGRVKLT